MTDKDIYERRDFLLGQIDERTAHIPQMRKDINKLSKKVAVAEFKSGLWGSLGGAIAVFLYYLKDYLLYGGRGH